MKYKSIFFLLYCATSFCQNISLDNLISLRSQNLGAVEEYLSSKNWNFLKTNENGNLKNVIFTYNKNDYSENAQSFITYMFSDDFSRKRIYMQVNSKDVYNNFISSIKKYNCKRIINDIEDGGVTKIYQGKTITFVVKIMMSNDDNEIQNNIYTFYLMTNIDYQEYYITQ